jgi:predicted ATPase
MDPWTILTWVALFIGMVAGIVQVVDYIQKMREKRQVPATPTSQIAISPPGASPPQMPLAAPEPAPEPEGPLDNLPMEPTPLVGRTEEAGHVTSWLRKAEVRLVTLTGPGGVGKSRVALAAATEVLPEFEHGVWLVSLENVADPLLLAQTIAGVLKVKPSGTQPLTDALKEYLRTRHVLLFLDNFERVVDAAPLLSELLAAAPGLKMLVTSRSTLRLMGERELPISPFPVPDPDHAGLDDLRSNASVSLFVDRCQAVRPDFALTEENAQAVAEICARLDGLPLAIELAAARTRLLTPQAIADRLKGSLKLLSGGARDLPARQQTLYATIAWSYDLLGPEEQALFRRVAVFRGGCTLDAVEAVMQAQGGGTAPLQGDVIDGLSSLIDKSLIRQEEMEGTEARYPMLATIRDFGIDKLHESGEVSAVLRAHAMFYLRLVEDAEPKLLGGEQVIWLDRLEREHDNIRAALDWSLSEDGDRRVGLRVAGALLWFWQTRGYLGEGRTRLDSLLMASGDPQYNAERSKALITAGRLATLQGDFAAASHLFSENLEIQRSGDDPVSTGHALVALGSAYTGQADYASARAHYEEALTLLNENNSPIYTAMALVGLGEACLDAGDPQAARPNLENSLDLFRKQGNKAGEGFALYNLGYAAHESGDPEEAQARFLDSLRLREELGNRQSIAMCLFGLSEVASSKEQWERAATLLAAGQRLLTQTGTQLGVADEARYTRAEQTARARLSEVQWDAAWARGAAMGVAAAVEYARSDA